MLLISTISFALSAFYDYFRGTTAASDSECKQFHLLNTQQKMLVNNGSDCIKEPSRDIVKQNES
jgi:hypothetical protein